MFSKEDRRIFGMYVIAFNNDILKFQPELHEHIDESGRSIILLEKYMSFIPLFDFKEAEFRPSLMNSASLIKRPRQNTIEIKMRVGFNEYQAEVRGIVLEDENPQGIIAQYKLLKELKK